MNKTLEQIQEENRKFIIMANNPTAKTYDEALEMELRKIKTCKHSLTLWDNSNEQLYLEDYKNVYYIDYDHSSGDPWSYTEYVGKFEDIIKLTLNKVLISLGNKSFFTKNGKISFSYEKWGIQNGFNRVIGYGRLDLDLKKETLEERSEETQREINKLFIKQKD